MEKIKEFWLWFSEYHEAFYHLMAFSEREQVYYYNELSIKLEDIHPELGFVVYMAKNGKKAKFTITTHGETEGRIYVTQLVSMAPKIPTWRIKAFIQPKIYRKALKQGVEHPFEFKAFQLQPSHIFWAPVDIDPDTYKYEVVFYFKGLQYRNLQMSYEYIIDCLITVLLNLLGERQFNQQIKIIYFDEKGSDNQTWYPLYQLPKFLKNGDLE